MKVFKGKIITAILMATLLIAKNVNATEVLSNDATIDAYNTGGSATGLSLSITEQQYHLRFWANNVHAFSCALYVGFPTSAGSASGTTAVGVNEVAITATTAGTLDVIICDQAQIGVDIDDVLVFVLADAGGFYVAGDYHSSIEKPYADNYGSDVPLRVATDILASQVAGSGDSATFEVKIEDYDGSWGAYDTLTYDYADAPLTYSCNTSFAGPFVGPCIKLGTVADTFKITGLPSGTYRISARVALVDNSVAENFGDWSSTVAFTVGSTNTTETNLTDTFTDGASADACAPENPYEWDGSESTAWNLGALVEAMWDSFKKSIWDFFWVTCETTQPLLDLKNSLAQHAPFRQAFQFSGYLINAIENEPAPEDRTLSIDAPPPWNGTQIVLFDPDAIYDFFGGDEGWGTYVKPMITAGTALALGAYFWGQFIGFFL